MKQKQTIQNDEPVASVNELVTSQSSRRSQSMSPSTDSKSKYGSTGVRTVDVQPSVNALPAPLQDRSPVPSASAKLRGKRGALATFLVQLRALLMKNFILKKRAWKTTLFELLMPVLITTALVGLRAAIPRETKLASLHLNSPISINGFDARSGLALMTAKAAYWDFKIALVGDADFQSDAKTFYAAQYLPKLVSVRDRLQPNCTALRLNVTTPSQTNLEVCTGYPGFCLPGCALDQGKSKTFDIYSDELFDTRFANSDQIVDYLTSSGYGVDASSPSMWSAMVLDSKAPAWSYSLMSNATRNRNFPLGPNGLRKTVPTFVQEKDELALGISYLRGPFGGGGWTAQVYQQGGFLSMQAFMDAFILDQTVPSDKSWQTTEISMQPFPTPEFVQDDFATRIGGVIGLFFALVYLWPVTRIVKAVVEEKERRLREGMKMMGLQSAGLWLSWWIIYAALFCVSSVFMTIVTKGSVYQYSDGSIIFLSFWLFSLSVFSFAYLFAAIFDRARLGSTIAAILFLMSFFVVFALGPRIGSGAKTASSLLPIVAFSLFQQQVLQLESANQGLRWSTLDREFFNFSAQIGLLMIFLDLVLYLVIALYLEQVKPGKYGVPQKWWFFVDKNFWCPPKRKAPTDALHSDNAADDFEFPDHFQPVSNEVAARVGVSVRHLQKEFPSATGEKVVAVNDLSLDLFEGQVFCLLGHNGAGKTTTINMLTGLYVPTAGQADFFGNSIATDMQQIRYNLGVCPQHDILWDTLTVKEHLQFYATLKGIPGSEQQEEITRFIEDVGLTEKVDSLTSSLSGGQKRKLSVAIALLGGSKVVFLDEPTSGMDPYSRRATWNLIKKYSAGRVIILTTHFMDEADYLGDRIAIMHHGEIKICGSSLFLKSRFGVGYTVTVSKTDQDSLAENQLIKALVAEHCGDQAQVTSEVAGEMSFRIPLSEAKHFPPLFRAIDERKDELHVATYGVSVTTLEEVFLRVGNEQAVETTARTDEKSLVERLSAEAKESQPGKLQVAVSDDRRDVTNEGKIEPLDDFAVEMDPSDKGVFWRHTHAILAKRWHNTRRDRKVLYWTIVYPLIIMVAGIGLLKYSVAVFASEPLELSARQYNQPAFTPINEFYADNTTVGLGVTSASQAGLDIKSVLLGRAPVPQGLVDSNGTFDSRVAMQEYLLTTGYRTGGNTEWAWEGISPKSIHKQSRYTALLFDEMSATRTSLTLFFNTTAAHSLPIAANQATNLALRKKSGDDGVSVTLSSFPFPRTKSQDELQLSSVVLVVCIALAFIPANFIGFLVQEKQTNVKHQQLISGVSVPAYWFSTLVWDVLNFMPAAFACMIVLVIFDIEKLIGDAAPVVLLALLMFILAVAPFTYAMSFLFSNSSSAQNLTLLFNIVTGGILTIVNIVLQVLESTQDIASDLVYIWRLFPIFCLGEVMVNTSIRDVVFVWGSPQGLWSWLTVGKPMLYLAIHAVFWMAVVLVCEAVLATPKLRDQWDKLIGRKINPPFQPLSDDEKDPAVEAERERVADPACQDMIRVEGLRKAFKTNSGGAKVAVRDLWFGIPRGQCFGFLGINGAGKTTTLKQLTGDLIPTAGGAHLNERDILTEQVALRRQLGYCPQFDALIPTLTAYEHLTMFARIKGVKESEIKPYVERLVQRLALTEFAAQPAGGYSGGNKRKLSVAIAMIGSPPIVFLDEPSTGMDPGSRRFMWDLIAQTMAGRSVILTTHSMEECEALCARIGIMVGGRLRCVGSSQQLKSQHGSGYQIDAATPNVDQFQAFVAQHFQDVQLLERHGDNLKVRISKQGTCLADVFELIETNRDQLSLVEYSVSETTLEQIFISFAKQQEEETGAIAGIQ